MTNYEQLLALSTGLDPKAREYVTALLAEHREMREAFSEYIAAADNCITTDDDVSAMLRFGKADESARAILAKVQAP